MEDKTKIRDTNINLVKLKAERKKIDCLDSIIARQLNNRLKILKRILKLKQSLAIRIFQPKREKEKLALLKKISLNPNFTQSIFRVIMHESRKFQEGLI